MTSGSTRLGSALVALALGASCAGQSGPGVDPGLEGLALTSVKPAVIVPGTVLHLDGESYVDVTYGVSRLRLRGTLGGTPLDVVAPARFVDYGRLEVKVDAAFLALLPAPTGKLEGEALVEVDSKVDGETYISAPVRVSLELRDRLMPRLDAVPSSAVIHVNDPIELSGDGLLRGGDEGTTFAIVEGCFTGQGTATCTPVAAVEIPVVPTDPYERTRGSFAFAPAIAGIRPGELTGTIKLRNVPRAGGSAESATRPTELALLIPSIGQVAPDGASLGQYIDVRGGGFVGGVAGHQTTLQLRGKLTRKSGAQADLDLILVPEFVRGPLVRYVLSEDDSLGRALDLRRETGTFTGTVTPITRVAADTVTGAATPLTFSILPVKQVIYVHFLPSYTESLRIFGLRALDARIRARVLEVARRDYATVNVDFRETPPTDFALYSRVDISGPDPNQQGLFGYDNTPGKDRDNLRLFDRIGGVNASTQEDGSAGYGGVFIESLFAFSRHPKGHARPIGDDDDLFDRIFDPFRPDAGGRAVTSVDFGDGGIPVLSGSGGCPAQDRRQAAACAVWTLGSLIGTTTSHEIGHSLGLANPDSDGFHNFGDEPNRLMDSGGNRPFRERAELDGQGPGRFCDLEYEYLRRILPTDEPTDRTSRPSCF
jgi:hypothetical protein